MQKNQYAITLLKRGIITIPILPNSKVPPATLKNWQNYQDTDIPKLISAWTPLKNSQYNLAVVTNYTGQIVCLDFDIYDNNIRDYHDQIKDNLPPTYTEISASGGYHYFYRTTEPLSSRKVTNCYELRADKNYTLIAPSTYLDPHTNTIGEYAQVSEIPLDPQQLPILPDFFVTHHDAPTVTLAHPQTTPHKIQELLSYIPSDDRETWIKVAAALKSESPNYLSLFIDWSKTSPKFVSIQDCEKTWNSFNRDGLTISSLYFFAEEHGYPHAEITQATNLQIATTMFPEESAIDQRIQATPTFNSKLKHYIETSAPLSKAEQLKELQKHDDSFYYSCPSPLGNLTKELCSLSRNPQPAITFATLLATTAYLKAPHYKTSDRDNAWHPTHYISCFAPTSSGKGFAQDIILEVLTSFQRLSGIVDNFKSVPALTATLKNAPDHNIFQQLDEASSFFKAPTEKTPAYLEDLLPELTKLWSKADSVYISSGTKKEKFKDRAEIINPTINILNFSQPDSLYSLSGSSLVYSGLLPRFLFFVDERLGSTGRQGKVRPPESLIAYFEKYQASYFEQLEGTEKSYKIVTLSAKAKAIYEEFEQAMFDKRVTLRKRHDPLNDMLGKAAEIAGRVAVTLADEVIEADLMLWCTQMVEKSIQVSFVALADIGVGQQYKKFSDFEETMLNYLRQLQSTQDYRPVEFRQLQQKLSRHITNIGGSSVFQSILKNMESMGYIKMFTKENVRGPAGKLISVWHDSLDEIQ
jgi:hypothetical protein